MLQMIRMCGMESELATEFRLVGMGFLAQTPYGSPSGQGLQATYNVPAGVNSTINSDTILVSGYIEFMCYATIAGSVSLKIQHIDPATQAVLFTDTIGTLVTVTPLSFGARSSPAAATDRVYALIQLQFNNLQAGASTVTNPRLWASAA